MNEVAIHETGTIREGAVIVNRRAMRDWQKLGIAITAIMFLLNIFTLIYSAGKLAQTVTELNLGYAGLITEVRALGKNVSDFDKRISILEDRLSRPKEP
jgi:hypothetical protein